MSYNKKQLCVCVTASGKAFHAFILYHDEENQENYDFQVTFNECSVVKLITEIFGLLEEEAPSCECMDCFPSVLCGGE